MHRTCSFACLARVRSSRRCDGRLRWPFRSGNRLGPLRPTYRTPVARGRRRAPSEWSSTLPLSCRHAIGPDCLLRLCSRIGPSVSSTGQLDLEVDVDCGRVREAQIMPALRKKKVRNKRWLVPATLVRDKEARPRLCRGRVVMRRQRWWGRFTARVAVVGHGQRQRKEGRSCSIDRSVPKERVNRIHPHPAPHTKHKKMQASGATIPCMHRLCSKR